MTVHNLIYTGSMSHYFCDPALHPPLQPFMRLSSLALSCLLKFRWSIFSLVISAPKVVFLTVLSSASHWVTATVMLKYDKPLAYSLWVCCTGIVSQPVFITSALYTPTYMGDVCLPNNIYWVSKKPWSSKAKPTGWERGQSKVLWKVSWNQAEKSVRAMQRKGVWQSQSSVTRNLTAQKAIDCFKSTE